MHTNFNADNVCSNSVLVIEYSNWAAVGLARGRRQVGGNLGMGGRPGRDWDPISILGNKRATTTFGSLVTASFLSPPPQRDST